MCQFPNQCSVILLLSMYHHYFDMQFFLIDYDRYDVDMQFYLLIMIDMMFSIYETVSSPKLYSTLHCEKSS